MVNSLDEQAVNKQKQNSAFPPNFVHSLDSTHMMYTALECSSKNITFAAVHDSFWSHAADTKEMGEILRDQFVNLHSYEARILENLETNFKMRYPNVAFPKMPP